MLLITAFLFLGSLVVSLAVVDVMNEQSSTVSSSQEGSTNNQQQDMDKEIGSLGRRGFWAY